MTDMEVQQATFASWVRELFTVTGSVPVSVYLLEIAQRLPDPALRSIIFDVVKEASAVCRQVAEEAQANAPKIQLIQ